MPAAISPQTLNQDPASHPATKALAARRRQMFGRWFLYFAPWVTVLLLALGFYNHSRFASELAGIEAENAALIKNGSTVMSRVLQRLASDVLVLSNDGDFLSYLDLGGAGRTTTDLAEEWASYLRVKQTFDQISYLDESGQERLRVNYNDGQPAVAPPAKLRNRAARPYFRDARRLARGELYLSPLELNVEGEDVELPIKPVIRVALPAFNRAGQRRGVLVISYQANDLLFRLNATRSMSDIRIMLFNAQGYWLHGAAKGDEWAFMFGRPVTMETRYPGIWEHLLAADRGQLQNGFGLWSWSTLHPLLETEAVSLGADPRFEPARAGGDPATYFWKLVALAPAERVQAVHDERRQQFISVALAAMLLIALSAWRMAMARQRQELAEQELRLTNQTLELQVNERTRRLQNEIFDRQMAERRYRESSEQYQHMIANTVDAYWLLDDRAGFLDANPAACDMLAVSRDVLLGMALADFAVAGNDVESRITSLMLAGSERFETRLRRLDGSIIDVEVSASYLPDYLRFIAFVRDISERKRAERERRLAAMVMSNADEAIFVAGVDGTVLSVNPAFTRVTGFDLATVLGESVDRLGITALDGRASLAHLLAERSGWRAEMRGRRRTGEVYPVWFSATEVRDADDKPINYVCVFSDITEIKESQARLDFLAHHDALTALPNRLLFRARLEHSLERAGRSKNRIAVMFIDLDHFKEVNDTLGHAVGDQLLIDLAGAMSNCLRAEDTLARLGGDEFVVLLEQVAGDDSVETVLEKFRQIYPWAVVGDGHRIEVTASIGIALYPDHADNADNLVMQADAAMYRAKENGRNRAVYA